MGLFDIFKSKEDLEREAKDKQKQEKAEFLYGRFSKSKEFKSDDPAEIESLLGLFLRQSYNDPTFPFKRLHLTGTTRAEIFAYLLQSVELRASVAQEKELLEKDMQDNLRKILSLIENTGDDPGSYIRMYEQKIPGLISIQERLAAQGRVKEAELFDRLLAFVQDVAAGNESSSIGEWRSALMSLPH